MLLQSHRANEVGGAGVGVSRADSLNRRTYFAERRQGLSVVGCDATGVGDSHFLRVVVLIALLGHEKDAAKCEREKPPLRPGVLRASYYRVQASLRREYDANYAILIKEIGEQCPEVAARDQGSTGSEKNEAGDRELRQKMLTLTLITRSALPSARAGWRGGLCKVGDRTGTRKVNLISGGLNRLEVCFRDGMHANSPGCSNSKIMQGIRILNI